MTTFGRGGSDYSAAVVAVAMGAEILEVWKDVAGFMSADPKFVPEAQLIPLLSYEEVAELAYFGAKILHPRTVEPIRRNKLNIAVKNTLNPDATGSLISSQSPKLPGVVKSVAHDTDIGVIKIHGSGVGARPGILARITGQMTDSGLNIRSVVTSQTCISLILAGKDLEPGYQALKSLRPKPYRRLEKIKNLALVSIVGEACSNTRVLPPVALPPWPKATSMWNSFPLARHKWPSIFCSGSRTCAGLSRAYTATFSRPTRRIKPEKWTSADGAQALGRRGPSVLPAGFEAGMFRRG